MKPTYYLLMFALLLAASCASPKYTYHFDHYNYGVTKTTHEGKTEIINTPASGTLQGQELASKSSLLTRQPASQRTMDVEKGEMPAQRLTVSKAERRELKQQIKKYIRDIKEDKVEAGKANLDHDLKLAAIFGSVGVVALIIGTDAFVIIGGIALIIGVVFFVRWLLRQ